MLRKKMVKVSGDIREQRSGRKNGKRKEIDGR